MMSYHTIMNSDHKVVSRKTLAEKTKCNHNNTIISNVEKMEQKIGVKIKYVKSMSKSKRNEQVKEKMKKESR